MLVRGSLSKRRVEHDVTKVNVGVGRRIFGDSTPGPISLGRVAKGRRSHCRVLTRVLEHMRVCCGDLRVRSFTICSSRVSAQCTHSLFHHQKLRPCRSTGNGFLTQLLQMRRSKQFILRSRKKDRQRCLFGRIRCVLWRVCGPYRHVNGIIPPC